MGIEPTYQFVAGTLDLKTVHVELPVIANLLDNRHNSLLTKDLGSFRMFLWLWGSE